LVWLGGGLFLVFGGGLVGWGLCGVWGVLSAQRPLATKHAACSPAIAAHASPAKCLHGGRRARSHQLGRRTSYRRPASDQPRFMPSLRRRNRARSGVMLRFFDVALPSYAQAGLGPGRSRRSPRITIVVRNVRPAALGQFVAEAPDGVGSFPRFRAGPALPLAGVVVGTPGLGVAGDGSSTSRRKTCS